MHDAAGAPATRMPSDENLHRRAVVCAAHAGRVHAFLVRARRAESSGILQFFRAILTQNLGAAHVVANFFEVRPGRAAICSVQMRFLFRLSNIDLLEVRLSPSDAPRGKKEMEREQNG
jgi:hypothetical protein